MSLSTYTRKLINQRITCGLIRISIVRIVKFNHKIKLPRLFIKGSKRVSLKGLFNLKKKLFTKPILSGFC